IAIDPAAIATRSAVTTTAADLEAARADGSTIRQLATAHCDHVRGVLTAWVAPVAVPRDDVFGRTTGANNAAVISGRYSGETTIAGAGAGGDATAVAIISDIAAIARDRA